MLGGFLGAGKTTTVLRVAQHFQKQGKRVGLITNDQAAGLVDTALLEELNLPVREIAGGCFCCKSEGLVEALGRLTAESTPEVFIAEPVGSCTDLIATVTLPLQQIYKQGYIMAPYAVLVDPYRAMQSLGAEGEPLFSPDVNYIYRKQLEEAEIIAINKVDVMHPERLAKVRRALEKEYPEARIIEMASRPGQGMEPLFQALESTAGQVSKIMEVDYVRYGGGEALLGWVNVQAKLALPAKAQRKNKPEDNNGFNAAEWLHSLAKTIQATLRRRKIEIAHLKASLVSDAGALTAVQLTQNAGEPELTRKSEVVFKRGELLVNLRAEGNPDVLLATVLKTFVQHTEKVSGLSVVTMRSEHFRPGQPKPTHRVQKI
jgi:G3E family GTPase